MNYRTCAIGSCIVLTILGVVWFVIDVSSHNQSVGSLRIELERLGANVSMARSAGVRSEIDYIDFDHDRATEAELEILWRDSSLVEHVKWLTLCGSGITDSTVERLVAFRGLRRLELYDTGVTGSALQKLSGMSGLVSLVISGGEVDCAQLHGLAEVPILTSIDLSRTTITDDCLKALVGLEKLQTVSLIRCDITERGIIHLKGLKELHTVVVSKGQITPDALQKLRAEMAPTNIREI
jgi:hypothetical protein